MERLAVLKSNNGSKEILIVSAVLPLLNADNAGSLHLAREIVDLLKSGIRVHLISFYKEGDLDHLKNVPAPLASMRLVFFGNPMGPIFRFFKVVLSLFSPLLLYWRRSDRELRSAISDILSNNHIQHLNFQWTSMGRFIPYTRRKFPRVKISLTMSDVDSQAYSRKLPDVSVLQIVGTRLLQRIDTKVVELSDKIVTLSEKDADLLRSFLPETFAQRIFAGRVNTDLFWELPPPREIRIVGFLGKLSRSENYGAIQWFLDQVWPRLADSGLELKIAGVGLPLELADKVNCLGNATYLGFVDNLHDFFESCDIFIAPLQLGGGIKFKVVQALSAARVVVGSDIAFEGIDPGRILPRCTTSDEFRELIMKLKTDPDFAKDLQQNSRSVARGFVGSGANPWIELGIID